MNVFVRFTFLCGGREEEEEGWGGRSCEVLGVFIGVEERPLMGIEAEAEEAEAGAKGVEREVELIMAGD